MLESSLGADRELVLSRFLVGHGGDGSVFLLSRFDSFLAAVDAGRTGISDTDIATSDRTSPNTHGDRISSSTGCNSPDCGDFTVALWAVTLVGVQWSSLEYNYGG